MANAKEVEQARIAHEQSTLNTLTQLSSIIASVDAKLDRVLAAIGTPVVGELLSIEAQPIELDEASIKAIAKAIHVQSAKASK